MVRCVSVGEVAKILSMLAGWILRPMRVASSERAENRRFAGRKHLRRGGCTSSVSRGARNDLAPRRGVESVSAFSPKRLPAAEMPRGPLPPHACNRRRRRPCRQSGRRASRVPEKQFKAPEGVSRQSRCSN